VKTEFVVYPDEGHDFYRHEDQIDVMTRVVDWFDTNLGAGAR
jgi:dipeptidyl aminopeptidase/acylaminoacyl peptidase